MKFLLLVMSLWLMAGCAEVDDTGNPVVYYGAQSAEDVPAPGEDVSPSSDALDAADVPFRPDTPSGDVRPDLGDALIPDVALDVVDAAAPADVPDVQTVDVIMVDTSDAAEEADSGMPADVVVLDIVDAAAPADASDVQTVDAVMALDRPDVVDVPPAVDLAPDMGVCPSGQILCGGACVDTRTNVNNCGTCGTVCPARSNATATCVAGACGIACATGFGNCDSNATNGCEIDVRTAVNSCGACGTVCPARPNAAPACATGACGLTCATSFGNCDGNVTNGCETDTRTSALHCGACGTICPSGTCEAGICLIHPVIDIVFVDSRVTGLWVRAAGRGAPNPRGGWAYMPCASSSPGRTCRIRLDRLTVPGSDPLRPITGWSGGWGLETIPTTTSSTAPLCPIGARDCPGCGMWESFTCLRVACATTGTAPENAVAGFRQLLDNVLPPGMSGSGTVYGFRMGFGNDTLTCPTAPAP